MVTVKWFGHCCYQIQNTATILTDPHDGPSLGLPTPDSQPDIVTISHPHEDHASGRHLFPDATILEEPTHTQIKGATITGVKAYHDDAKGARLGPNTIFVIEIDSIRFAHTGDLGHPLTERHLKEMGHVDILMQGIGREPGRAEENIAKLNPKVVMPMHYNTPGIIFPWFQLPEVDDFIRDKPHRRLGGNETTYVHDTLPETTEVHVFSLEK